MSKVAEKIILSRLNEIDKKLKITPSHQFGFKSGHSTTMAAAKVVHDVTINFNKNKNTILLLLDMEKAFDTVWHNGLLYKLDRVMKFPSNLTYLLKSYLSQRSFQVRVNQTLSTPKTIRAGVPQGTAISPKLYTLYTADVPTYPNTKLLLYADDTAIYSHSYYAQVGNKQIKYHLLPLIQYYTDWKIKINEQKTEQIILTKKFTNNKIIEPLKINNAEIKITNKVKYLGVTLDKSLSFKPHISSSISKAYVSTQKLYPLLAKNSRMSLANKILIYKTIIRPTLTYACPVWNRISETQRKRLQIMQNKLLRYVCSANRYARIDWLHQTTGIPRIADYIDEISQKFYTTHIHRSTVTTNMTDGRHIIENEGLTAGPHKHKLIYQNLPVYRQAFDI